MVRTMREIREALRHRWEQRAIDVAFQADAAAENMDSQAAYKAGFKAGYWDGATDLIEAVGTVEPDPMTILPSDPALANEH